MLNVFKNLFGGRPKNDGPQKSILIVEDNAVDRRFAQKSLEKRGFKTFEAVNGQEGLEMARNKKPDAIVLDCEMPVMGGVEMCRQLKVDPELKDIPVVFLTSINTPQNVLDCFELDAENFLTKPVDARLLASQINALFDEIASK